MEKKRVIEFRFQDFFQLIRLAIYVGVVLWFWFWNGASMVSAASGRFGAIWPSSVLLICCLILKAFGKIPERRLSRFMGSRWRNARYLGISVGILLSSGIVVGGLWSAFRVELLDLFSYGQVMALLGGLVVVVIFGQVVLEWRRSIIVDQVDDPYIKQKIQEVAAASGCRIWRVAVRDNGGFAAFPFLRCLHVNDKKVREIDSHELTSVILHECGHLMHPWQEWIARVIYVVAGFGLIHLSVVAMQRLALEVNTENFDQVIVFLTGFFGVTCELLLYAWYAFERYREWQADAFVVKQGAQQGLINYLQKEAPPRIFVDVVASVFEYLHLSHPLDEERIAKLEEA